ncbi:MAG: hypothetical protein Q8O30_03525 [Candidatus Omnitrophota bacterium]|nr:hypothetical protein [Candidatus Omnitrophota bacterium]
MAINNYGIFYVTVGEGTEKSCLHSIASLRRYCSYPIKILSDRNFSINMENITIEIIKPRDYEIRWGIRNGDYFRLVALRDSPYDASLYLDNDHLIVSPRILDGFEIAKNFGMAIPMNSRVFLDLELKIGKDISNDDRDELSSAPKSLTDLDCGVTFYSHRSRTLLLAWLEEMERRPCTGPIALARAIWRTKQYPYILPYNWRVETPQTGIKNPIIVHLGHPHVKDFYEGNLPLWLWRIIWAVQDIHEKNYKKYLKAKAIFLGFVKKQLEWIFPAFKKT